MQKVFHFSDGWRVGAEEGIETASATEMGTVVLLFTDTRMVSGPGNLSSSELYMKAITQALVILPRS